MGSSQNQGDELGGIAITRRLTHGDFSQGGNHGDKNNGHTGICC